VAVAGKQKKIGGGAGGLANFIYSKCSGGSNVII